MKYWRYIYKKGGASRRNMVYKTSRKKLEQRKGKRSRNTSYEFDL